ncbi:MAG: sensor histidine kinase, partial [Nocardioidaceae bacterium]
AFVLTTVGTPLVLVTAGIPLLLVAVPLTQGMANAHRGIAGRVLGTPVPRPYRSTEPGLRRIIGWATDPARWRDYVWTAVSATAGFVMSVLAVSLLLSTVFYLIYPFLWWVTPAGVFDLAFGFIPLDTLSESFGMWVVAVVFALLWWWVTPALVRAKARIDRALLGRARTEELAERVQQVTESRAESVDFSAAELRRIERDLHDGAQARLVALGMSLGMADDLLAVDPDAARRLLVEARSTTTAALSDLRSVVRGIHPPVLADRGLAGAVEALAISLPIPVTITVDLDGRAPAPIESAAYFAVAECLANAGKHSAATQVWVSIGHHDGRLRLVVDDDGIGGAAMDKGSGLAGVARRLAVFDGTMDLSSPVGGPTSVSMEVPCELSSPKTSPSSGTG